MRRPSAMMVATAVLACTLVQLCIPVLALAVVPITLIVDDTADFPDLVSARYVTGRVYNPIASPVTDVTLRVTFKNAANSPIGFQLCPVGVHVLNDHTWTAFCQRLSPPAGTVSYTYSATGISISTHAARTQITPLPPQDDLAGLARRYVGTIQGHAFETKTGLLVFGEEWIEPPSFYVAAVDANNVSAVIPPGASQPYLAFARRLTIQDVHLSSLWYEWVDYAPSTVYRFYHRQNGTHFYTASEAEKTQVQNTLSGTYAYEGPAYGVNTASPSNMRPLYRFYNRRNGTHFYTASESERNNVQNTLSGTYTYDGPAYKVSLFPWYSRPVYRFFNKAAGTHFYTASEAEKANVIATLSSIYTYEGPAFYLAY